MPLEITCCPHCHYDVAFPESGICPSCQRHRNEPATSTAAPPVRQQSPLNTPPLSVKIISWFLIVTAGIGMISIPDTLNLPGVTRQISEGKLARSVYFGISIVALAIPLVSGVGMLRGHDWARWLYAFWGPVSLSLAFFGSHMTLEIVPGTFLYFVCIFFLFRPPATGFFDRKRSSRFQPDEDPRSANP